MLQLGMSLQNRYRITRQLGGGGMSAVYLAEDTRLPGRRCAIKEMSPNQLPTQDRNWAIQAFRQEAQMLANLKHPGLTSVTDAFAELGNWYLVMDYVEGETLEAHLQRAPGRHLSLDDALRYTHLLCDVLTYLHNQNPPVIFRDLKPGNVMLTPQGDVKLIDFGIARFFKSEKSRDTVNLGTPGYAAPEQYGRSGLQSGPRADVYSLGVLLLEMVTGYDPTIAPFPLPGPRSVMRNIPDRIEAVIIRATQVQPDLRYGTVREMQQALFPPTYPLQYPSGTTVLTRPKRRLSPTASNLRTRIVFAISIIVVWVSGLFLLNLVFPDILGSLITRITAIVLVIVVALLVVTVWPRTSRDAITKPYEPSGITSKPLNIASPPITAPSESPSISSPLLEFLANHIIEDLILSGTLEQLAHCFTDFEGERFVLTGYGRFGGTSLVKAAISRANAEFQNRGIHKGVLLALYFRVENISQNMEFSKVKPSEVTLCILKSQYEEVKDKHNWEALKEQADQIEEITSVPPVVSLTFHFSTVPTAFSSTSFLDRIRNGEIFGNSGDDQDFDFDALSRAFSVFFRRGKRDAELLEIIEKINKGKTLASRAILIFDRINNFDMLEMLATQYNSPRSTIIAVARRETFNEFASQRYKKRLRELGFKEWYVPCGWQSDSNYIPQMLQKFVTPHGFESSEAEGNFVNLCRHLEFTGRGALGNVLEELKHKQYWTPNTEGGYSLQLDPLPLAPYIRRHAWLQDVLDRNWAVISARLFGDAAAEDRARIGVYHVLEWMGEQAIFTLEDLLSVVNNAETIEMSISRNPKVVNKVLSNLLYVLQERAYIELIGPQEYALIWNPAVPPPPQEKEIIIPKVSDTMDSVQNLPVVTADKPQLDSRPEEVEVIEYTKSDGEKLKVVILDRHDKNVSREDRFPHRPSKLLVILVNHGADPQQLDKEEQIIRESIERSKNREHLGTPIFLRAAKVEEVQRALIDELYQIIHFAGNTDESGALVLENTKGIKTPIPQFALAELLSEFETIECVIFNAPHTLNQGKLVAMEVPFTIAMDGPVSGEAARCFTQGFYDAIGAGKGYRLAFRLGCDTLALQGYQSNLPKLIIPRSD